MLSNGGPGWNFVKQNVLFLRPSRYHFVSENNTWAWSIRSIWTGLSSPAQRSCSHFTTYMCKSFPKSQETRVDNLVIKVYAFRVEPALCTSLVMVVITTTAILRWEHWLWGKPKVQCSQTEGEMLRTVWDSYITQIMGQNMTSPSH